MIYLLHGAGLGGWVWDRLRPLLKDESEAVERTVDATLQQCIGELAARADHTSIIVGHSFAAQIALGVSSRVHVKAVVLVGGVTARPGRPFISIMPPPQRLLMKFLLKRAKNGIEIPKSLARKGYCNDLDEATTQLVLDRMQPEATRLYLDEADWRGDTNPRFYIRLLDDKSASQKTQERMIELTASRPMVMPGGHLAMLSQPQQLADLINGIR